jgi:hypothetical protein
MFKLRQRTVIALVIFVFFLGTSFTSASPAMAPSTVHPMVTVQVFHLDWVYLASFSTSYVKMGDLATFDVLSPSSVVELVFNARIRVNSFNLGSAGANFELRVDDTASTFGPAQAHVGGGEQTKDVFTSIDGIFTNLSTGSHTASMWIKGWNAGGSETSVNPYTWDSDHLVVKEYTPFGFAYLPLIQK